MDSLQTMGTNKAQTMTSREIAELVESRHDHVKISIERLIKSGVIGLPSMRDVKNSNNQTVQEYVICKRDTYIIVAQLSPAFTARLVDRWQELESQQQSQFKVPQSMSEALRLAADLSDKVIMQAMQIEAAAPAVSFVEKYADATNTKSFRQVCKALHANEVDFREFLTSQKIMYRLGSEWMPFACHMDAGRFVIKQGISNEHVFNSAKFTQKGFLWVASEWAKFQVREAA